MSIPHDIIEKTTQKIISIGVIFEDDEELTGYFSSSKSKMNLYNELKLKFTNHIHELAFTNLIDKNYYYCIFDIEKLYTIYPGYDFYETIKYAIMEHFSIKMEEIHIGYYNN